MKWFDMIWFEYRRFTFIESVSYIKNDEYDWDWLDLGDVFWCFEVLWDAVRVSLEEVHGGPPSISGSQEGVLGWTCLAEDDGVGAHVGWADRVGQPLPHHLERGCGEASWTGHAYGRTVRAFGIWTFGTHLVSRGCASHQGFLSEHAQKIVSSKPRSVLGGPTELFDSWGCSGASCLDFPCSKYLRIVQNFSCFLTFLS